MYKHEENQIDPRDKSLVTYNTQSKRFCTEASSLHAAGIEPHSHHFTIGGPKWVIYLWSEKFEMSIPYVHSRKVKDSEGELIADIFTPRFDSIVTLKEHNAHSASLYTELHILND
jgi:hypothetical protein